MTGSPPAVFAGERHPSWGQIWKDRGPKLWPPAAVVETTAAAGEDALPSLPVPLSLVLAES